MNKHPSLTICCVAPTSPASSSTSTSSVDTAFCPLQHDSLPSLTSFACLNQLQQGKIISKLTYLDSGVTEGAWSARIEAEYGGRTFTSKAQGNTKREAKTYASTSVLELLCGLPASPHPPLCTAPAEVCRAHETLRDALASASQHPVFLVSVDVEWKENTDKVTEIGYEILDVSSWFRGPACHMPSTKRHLVVEEHLALRNHLFLEDHKDDFDFGASEILPLQMACATLRTDIQRASARGSTYLVGHTVASDVKQLDARSTGSEEPSFAECFSGIIDVMLVDRWERKAREPRGLAKLLVQEGIPYKNLHNGGNDAVYTMEICVRQGRRLCGTEPASPASA